MQIYVQFTEGDIYTVYSIQYTIYNIQYTTAKNHIIFQYSLN